MLNLWLQFIIMAILIIISGTKLSKYGDIIADKTGIGEALIGSILVALATSLPELVTSITSSLVGAPNIAIGNVFGSNTFNLMILAVADLLYSTDEPIMLRMRYSNILSGLLGTLLAIIVSFSMLVANLTNLSFGFMGVGLDSVLLILIYVLGMRLIFRYDKKNPLDQKVIEEEEIIKKIPLKKAIIGFLLSAIVIVFAGIRLSVTGDQIATMTGIDQSFIGSIMVAAATSLPELVATISAISIGAYNMALGNVFGSNIFNMIIVFFADLFYREGHILSSVDFVHVITSMIVLMMSVIAIMGLFYRSKRTVFALKIGWDSFLIGIIYFLGVYLLFRLGISV
ncbi:MAG: sodium:calcium antiporter [Halanaerobiales bacterium]